MKGERMEKTKRTRIDSVWGYSGSSLFPSVSFESLPACTSGRHWFVASAWNAANFFAALDPFAFFLLITHLDFRRSGESWLRLRFTRFRAQISRAGYFFLETTG
jgi:hypothetical protein